MKKLCLAFSFLFLSIGNVFATDGGKVFSLDEALGTLEVTARPQFLSGVNEKDEFGGEKLKGDASDLTRFIEKIAKSLTGAAAAIAILMIILNSFTLVTAVGDSDAIGNAKKGLLWAFIGLLLIIFAYVLVKTIISTAYLGEITKTEESAVSQNATASTSNCVEPTLINIPPATYGEKDQDLEKTQSKVGDEDFPSVLFGQGLGDSAEAIQGKLKSDGFYKNLPANCQNPDGKYGQCTMQALQNYNESLEQEYQACLQLEKDQMLAETEKKAEENPEKDS